MQYICLQCFGEGFTGYAVEDAEAEQEFENLYELWSPCTEELENGFCLILTVVRPQYLISREELVSELVSY